MVAAPDNSNEATPAEPYQVVARRFRPRAFDEVVGQDEVLQSLRVALREKRIPHAFLFAGSRGVGKTTMARILARCLNCEHGPTPEPCGTCALCRSILDGSNTDVVEIDAASYRRIDDMRLVIGQIGFASMRSRYRVFILDEVHMLTKEAFNAFLKTLEEPPPNVVFVLATTELHKVPETIRSRCQVLHFRRIGDDDIQRRLQSIAAAEGVAIPAAVLADIAASVRGGMRDAETALERILPLARELGPRFDIEAYRSLVARVGVDATLEVCGALLRGEAGKALRSARELEQHGIDEREALGELVDMLRWLLLLRVDGPDSGLVPATGALRVRLQELALAAETHQLDAMIQAGLLGRERLRRLEDRGVVFELTLVRMAEAGALPTLADLLAEVRGGGRAAVRPASAAPAVTGAGGGAPPSVLRPAANVGTTASVTPGAAAAGLKGRLLAALRDQPLLHATIELCQITGPTAEGRVLVQLDTDRRMHRDRLAAPAVQTQISQLLQQGSESPLRVEFRLPAIAAPGAAGDVAAAAPSPAVTPGPAAQRVLDKFRGRVVAVNPEDRVLPEPQPDAPGPESAAPEEAD